MKDNVSLISFSVLLSSDYRRSTDFFELILYPDSLLKGFLSSRSSSVEFLGSLMYTIMSSTNSDSLTSSFLIYILFISFWCLIALAEISRTILNMYGESEQPCLVPDFSGNTLIFSPFCLKLAVDLLYISFIMYRNVFYITSLSKTFVMKGFCIFSKAFLVSNEMIIWFFFFSLTTWWISLTDFCMLNHPCISGIKPS